MAATTASPINPAAPTLVRSAFHDVEFSDLEMYEKLGGGSSGNVYRALWKSQQQIVAAKRLLKLDREVEILSQLAHRNIVRFYGAVTVEPDYTIVTEYCENGSVFDALHNEGLEFHFALVLQWAKDIAKGMNYLHYESPVAVIHRDLKSKNVLITKEWICKVCDFGSSKVFRDHTTRMSAVAGTMPWMSPEVIRDGIVTLACDIWSYGVVLWEMLTREVPFRALETYQVAWAVVEKNERLLIPSSCPAKFREIMENCWKTAPTERWTFQQILIYLENILDDDDSLVDETNSFMANREQWRGAIDESFKRMRDRMQEHDRRQEELAEKERQLRMREAQLNDQLEDIKGMNLNPFDANSWMEKDVLRWVKYVTKAKNYVSDYEHIFISNHITGARLLQLNLTDLKAMGICSIGHQIELMNEIEMLRSRNSYRANFPALSDVRMSSFKTSISQEQIDFTFIMVGIVLTGDKPRYHRWKVLLDVSANELWSPLTYIRQVKYTWTSDGMERSAYCSTAPYLMDTWAVGLEHDVKVHVLILFNPIVSKPSLLQESYRMTASPTQHTWKQELTIKHQVATSDLSVSILDSSRSGSSPGLHTPGGPVVFENQPPLLPTPPAALPRTQSVSGLTYAAAAARASQRQSSSGMTHSHSGFVLGSGGSSASGRSSRSGSVTSLRGGHPGQSPSNRRHSQHMGRNHTATSESSRRNLVPNELFNLSTELVHDALLTPTTSAVTDLSPHNDHYNELNGVSPASAEKVMRSYSQAVNRPGKDYVKLRHSKSRVDGAPEPELTAEMLKYAERRSSGSSERSIRRLSANYGEKTKKKPYRGGFSSGDRREHYYQ